MTTPLLVVLPTHAGDVDQAETLLKWCVELGNLNAHSLLIAADSELPKERVKAMLDRVRGEFWSVRAMFVPVGVKGWPLAANLVFRAVARQISEFYKGAWLWLEPDAVPLCEDWLDRLAEEYFHAPRPFMGAISDNEKPGDGLPVKYLSAIGVWPQDTFERLADLWKDPRFTGPVKPSKLSTATWQNTVRAFDMVAADYLVPRAHHTNLIQSLWGTDYNTPPMFVTERTELHPANTVTFDFIRKDAALFHRTKDVESFTAAWRIRLEAQSERFDTPTGGPVAIGGVLPEVKPGEQNVNWRGGDEKAKERRRAAAQRSKEYLEEARAKRAAEAQTAQQPQPANV